MIESDEEEDNVMDDLQCLPKDLATAMGSVKRSLLETLERVDTVQKKKPNVRSSPPWGPVLINKPTTRNHGNIKIMDKATAYMQKKNLEIPATFKGKSFAVLEPDELANTTTQVDLCVGNNIQEQNDIILHLINSEKARCLQFADDNPEIVLPDSLDLEENDDFTTQPISDDMSPIGSVGTVDPSEGSPTVNTKKKPCGLSHPFRVK